MKKKNFWGAIAIVYYLHGEIYTLVTQYNMYQYNLMLLLLYQLK